VRVWDLATGPAVSDPFPGPGRVIAVTAARPAGRPVPSPWSARRCRRPRL